MCVYVEESPTVILACYLSFFLFFLFLPPVSPLPSSFNIPKFWHFLAQPYTHEGNVTYDC